MAKEINPRLVFERLFAADGGGRSRAKRDKYRLSILDFVTEDARRLNGKLGAHRPPQARRIPDRRPRGRGAGSPASSSGRARPTSAKARLPAPDRHPQGLRRARPPDVRPDGPGLPGRRHADRHLRATPTRASTKSYPMIGVPEGHHDLSHHAGDPKKHEKIKKINRFHVDAVRLRARQAQGDPRGRRARCSITR